MKKIDVKNRSEIKLLLTCKYVLAIKGDQFRSFGGFQMWWYDQDHGYCSCCSSGWTDRAKTVVHCSLEKAAKVLFRNRGQLFMTHLHAGDKLPESPFSVNSAHKDIASRALPETATTAWR